MIAALIVTTMMAVLWIGSQANAASTAYLWKSTWPGGGSSHCAQAVVNSGPMDFQAYALRLGNSSSLCGSYATNAPTNSLAAKAHGYRDGAWCGSTSWKYNTSGPAWKVGIGGKMCIDPWGTQSWKTYAQTKRTTSVSGGSPYNTYSTGSPTIYD